MLEPLRPIALTLGAALCLGCARQPTEETKPRVLPQADRLSDGEPLIGAAYAFGLRLPDGLRVVARYAKSVHLSGPVPLASVLEAVQSQLTPTLVELTPKRATLERVSVKTDPTKRLLRLEVVHDGPTTRLNISDITPPKTPEGLTEAQRWERAGRNPDGTPKDPSQML